jgi:ribosomal protein S18 acetylase RimI-like enzyme
MSSNPQITLRDSLPEDRNLLFKTYASTRAQEMALVPWSDEQKHAFLQMQFEAQDADYRKRYPQADFKIIMRDDQAVGRLYVRRDEDRIHILDITVLPDYRNAGIGSALISDLLAEAAQTSKSVGIYVEDFNPSLRLFERLGFSVSRQDGFNLLLEWRKP